MKELEENKDEPNAKPMMVLFFDEDSDFCRGALQSALNSKAAAKLAKDVFRLLKVDMKDLATAGVAKKYGAKGAHIAFYSPGGKLLGRYAESNASAAQFVSFLEGMVVKAKKAAKAEAEAREKKIAKAAPANRE